MKVYDRPKENISSLRGLRLGVLTSYINHTIDETSIEVSASFFETLNKLSSAGAELVHFDDSCLHPTNLALAEVALFEYEDSINEYLSDPRHRSCPKNLAEIMLSGLTDEAALGPTWPLVQLPEMSISSPEYHARLHRIDRLKLSYAKNFARHSLDAIIYPHQTILTVAIGQATQPGRNGLLTSLTGAPGVVVPMGFSSPSRSAKIGVPMGMEVVGMWGQDKRILGISDVISGILSARKPPILD